MVPACPGFVMMLLASEAQQIEFIDQAKILQQVNGPVNSRAVDIRRPFLSASKQ